MIPIRHIIVDGVKFHAAAHPGGGIWAAVNAALREFSEDAPKDGCYDKTDFLVRWADGEEYRGRLDIKHHSCEDPDIDLSQHIRDHALCATGRVIPRWVYDESEERQRELIETWVTKRDAENLARWSNFLDQYETGTTPLPPVFDPSKVGIERKRFSVTQGEVLLKYDGRDILQFGDKIEMDAEGQWHGLPDEHWVRLARRIFDHGLPHERIEPLKRAA